MAWYNFLAPGLHAVSNMASSFMHPERPFKEAGKELNKSYKTGQQYLQPYNQQGQDQYGRLNMQANLLNDPAALENQWAQSYQESPYALQEEQKAKEAGLDAASSMGLMGSSGAVNNIQQSAHDIAQGDRQAYMTDLMNKYLASIGIGKSIYDTGANAAGAQGTNAINNGQNLAMLKYGQTAAPGQTFGNLVGMGANAGINYLTGGMSGIGQKMMQPNQVSTAGGY